MAAKTTDVLLVGSGVMSATLGTFLKQLDPSLNIAMVERLNAVAQESSNGWNNAGTGHAAYCELNYTPDNNGIVATDNAHAINASFEISLQFWSYLVERGQLPEPTDFINQTPHMSFVWGDANVDYLRRRYEALKKHHLFAEMEYSEDHATLTEWMPLVMQGRDSGQKVAGTRIRHGADVNFGALTRSMVEKLNENGNFELLLNHSVDRLTQQADDKWAVELRDVHTNSKTRYIADFVFLGGGGGALPLLQKSGVDESLGYGGFPVSGQWLVCTNPDIVKQHHAKVYGRASIGAPPMSVPHLDTRVIDGKSALLFGPFAGFTTKFLKQGSFFDLIGSLRLHNIIPMLQVGLQSFSLIKYLITEVLQLQKTRVKALQAYFPEAQSKDWTLAIAGQRVQIIKKANGKGKLEFGTEVVTAKDGSLAALLGASPGASIAVPAMLEIIERCFAERLETLEWQAKMKEMIPSYRQSLIEDAELLKQVRQRTLETLKLDQE